MGMERRAWQEGTSGTCTMGSISEEALLTEDEERGECQQLSGA